MNGIEQAVAKLAFQKGDVRPGGAEALAEALGVSQQAVSQWRAQGYVPWERAATVSALTGVPARELVDPRIAGLLT